MIEREKTYLSLILPDDIDKSKHKDMLDIYVWDPHHPELRIRKRWQKYEITKKKPVDNDPSIQQEKTIPLTLDEYNELAQIPGRRIEKRRYRYLYNWQELEIDVFQWDLTWLILVDAEFENNKDMQAFEMPDFCERDVTQDKRVAWGMLAGKSFAEIKQNLS